MYAENTFGHKTKKSINMFLRISKDGTSSKCLIKVFHEVIASGKKLLMYLLDLHIISRKVLRVFPLNKALHFRGSLSYRHEGVYTYDDQIGFPILIPRRVLNDLSHAKPQKWQMLLDTGFFRLFPLKNLGSHPGVLGFDVMVYDK